MEAMKKWVSMLIALSLAFSALTGSAIAASVTAGVSADSELIEDSAGDAAALGDSKEEEGTASAGIKEDSGEEEDVMATVTGDDTAAAEEEEEAAEGETSVEEETVSAGIKQEEPEASGTTDEPETTSGNAEEEPEASQPQPGEEEEPEASQPQPGEEEEPEALSRLPFTDVPVGHWSYEFVLYAYENDLVRGVSATEFNPTGVMTRAAFVTTLYRLSAKLESDMTQGTAAFTDISDINAEFQSAILWAVAHGIVTGKSAETFAPRENITRQQMCAILTRYLRDYLRYDLSGYLTESDGFADSDTISGYAKEAVSVMRGMGVIDGRTADGVSIFDPAGSASRAAVVKVLSNAVQMIPDLPILPEQEPEQNGETVTSGDSVSDNGETVASGDSVSNNGETVVSGDSVTDTTDKSDSDSNKSGSNKSSGGGSGGGSGGSSGGGSGGGSGGSSGSTTPVIVEPENADRIFSYIDEIIASYEANPPTNAMVSNCMEILIRDMRSIKAVRESKTVLVDAAYVKEHYKSDMDKLIETYQLSTISARLELAKYLKGLATPTSKLMDVLEYFGLVELLA